MREELLNREMFANLKEAKVLAEDYRDYYNHRRPHGALGYLTPRACYELGWKPHRNTNISVSSGLRRSPVFRISKPFLSKFITASKEFAATKALKAPEPLEQLEFIQRLSL